MAVLLRLLLAICWPVALGNVKLGKHIVKYTEEKLNYVLSQADRPPIFLEIFSPTCPACQAIAPRMNAAASRLRAETEIKVVALDGTQAEQTMQKLGAKEFPALFFLGANHTARLDLQRADTAAAIVHWATRLAAPAVRQVAAAELPPCTGAPQLVLRAPSMVPAFQSIAEEHKLHFEAFWITTGGPATAAIRHAHQADATFTWSDLTADTLDEEGERFEQLVKESLLPAVIMVDEPKKAMKMIESQQDAVLLWLVLNGTSSEACDQSCSAGGETGQALETHVAPWRAVLDEGVRLYRVSELKNIEEQLPSAGSGFGPFPHLCGAGTVCLVSPDLGGPTLPTWAQVLVFREWNTPRHGERPGGLAGQPDEEERAPSSSRKNRCPKRPRSSGKRW
ncbi:unnamed protein product [Durusdinium trenchii]|uniref:Thioredoxin domain-containing protein n=1 Tax=Durusdinium trenchii TaxID=1381693 RepID=A0ABP0QBU0_9DINO